MKKIIVIAVALVMTASVFAQSPEKMSYQAVVRNSSNALVKTQAVGMQISILQGTVTGTAVYTETQTPTTNANGLVSIAIGTGTSTDDFTTIDWTKGPYFIKTATDPTGGTNYTITGTNQLMSVPYALHAKTAGAHYIGEAFGGGVVYQTYTGTDGEQHGLIVNTGETKDSVWQRTGTTTNATSSWDGAANTNLMTDSPVATYVNALATGGFTDWYLPSISELNLLWDNVFFVNKALSTITGATLVSIKDAYWSSTESSSSGAFNFSFASGGSNNGTESTTSSVRAVRAF